MTNVWENAKSIKWHTYTPYAIGFDEVFQRLDALTQSDSFPRHNTVKEGEGKYLVEIALAGYDRSQLEVWTQENMLHISTVKDIKDDRNYIHKGIAKRAFTKSIQLEDDLEVQEVKFENGLLAIKIQKFIPESKRAKVFEIK